jgi:hypothetical protein
MAMPFGCCVVSATTLHWERQGNSYFISVSILDAPLLNDGNKIFDNVSGAVSSGEIFLFCIYRLFLLLAIF